MVLGHWSRVQISLSCLVLGKCCHMDDLYWGVKCVYGTKFVAFVTHESLWSTNSCALLAPLQYNERLNAISNIQLPRWIQKLFSPQDMSDLLDYF